MGLEEDYTSCIAPLECSDSFLGCDVTRESADAACPSLPSSRATAWTECRLLPEPTPVETPADLGDTVEEIIAAIYSSYLQEDQLFCACYEEFDFPDEETCLASRGFSDAEVDCKTAVYESYGDAGIESLECKGLAGVEFVACQGQVACEDSEAREECLSALVAADTACPDLPGSGESESIACEGIPDPE